MNDSCKWSVRRGFLTYWFCSFRQPPPPKFPCLRSQDHNSSSGYGTLPCRSKGGDGPEWHPSLVLSFQVTSSMVTSFERGLVPGSLPEVRRDVHSKSTNLHIHIAQQGSQQIIPFPARWRMFKITYVSKRGRNSSIARSCNFCVKKEEV